MINIIDYRKGKIISIHKGRNHKILAQLAGSFLISKESEFNKVLGWKTKHELIMSKYKVVMQEEYIAHWANHPHPMILNKKERRKICQCNFFQTK